MKDKIVNSYIKLFASHLTDLHKECVKDVYLSESDVIRHIHSGSHVIHTTKGYFRMCPSHAPLPIFYKDRVDYHLKAIPFSQNDFAFLTHYFANSNNLHSFIRYSLTRRYIDNNHHDFANKANLSQLSSYFSDNKDDFDRNLYDLAYSISADISQYRKNKYCNQPETFSANRILAQEALAKLLGIGQLFPHTEFVNLHIDNQIPSFGIMMEASGGLYPLKIGDKLATSVTPNLQYELSCLNVHDVICNEKDHRPGNYHIIMDETRSKANHIIVFDNDCRWTFFPSLSVTFRTYAGASSLVNDDEINRPFMDKRFVDNFLHITKKELYDCLSPFLNKLQLLACYVKIEKLKRAILNTEKCRKDFLLEPDEWSDLTIHEELSGKYGNTYLYIYHHWYERMLKEHPEIFSSFNINMSS